MKMQFEHQTVELPKIKQKNNALPDGGRGYETPEGKLYPSITTVLSVRNKKGLHEWRDRVGHDVANYIARTAAQRGTAVHKMCEDYLNNQHLAWPDEFEKHKSKNFLAWCLFTQMRETLSNINNIKCLESSLYSDTLKVSGQVDCIIFRLVPMQRCLKSEQDKRWINLSYLLSHKMVLFKNLLKIKKSIMNYLTVL